VNPFEPTGVPLCEAWEIEPGTVRRIEHGGQAYAVFNVAGSFHITDDTCTHGFASLSEGQLVGHAITCPWHGGEFDVRSGAPLAPPCTQALRVYRCRVDGDMVLAWFEESTDGESR
jgi:nitrite reductase/ring-hydroxylating ferredoxin subunit